jgi:uncharacterized protein YqeY
MEYQMTLKEQLKSDLKEAMKAKEVQKRDSIRSINTMIKQIEVDERIELDDVKIIQLIQKGIKQREEAIEQFKAAKRDDLVENEQNQIDIFSVYLPKQLTDEGLETLIQIIIDEVGASSIKDMGKVMNTAKEKVGGSADGKRINLVVKKLLL